MNGETVGIRERFSNGADWPGDSRVLGASDVANCHCEVELTIPGRRATHRDAPVTSGDVAWDSKKFGGHANKHMAEFGLDVTSAADRDRYAEITRETIDDYDLVGYDTWRGQHGDQCAFFFKGDTVTIVNLDKYVIVSTMVYEEGRNANLTRIRNSLRD